jgi:uncharacterized protein (TIGR02118 family)
MIKVSVLYPNGADARFDIDYYCDRHMPMVREKLGAALKEMAIDEGIGGGEPGSKPPYLAACHLTFDSVDAFQAAFGPHAGEIMADIPNYTNAQPIIQINQIRQVQG